jgi:hypothetical protein
MSRPCHTGFLIACLLALALLPSGCGGGDSSSTVAAETTEAAEPQNSGSAEATSSGPTKAVLQPVGDTKATGTILYRKKVNGYPLLKIRVQGLEPTLGEEKYVLWQMSSRDDMVPLATYVVGDSGKLNEDLQAGFESIAFLEDGSRTEMAITKVEDDDDWREGLGAGGDGMYDPAVPGKFILRAPLTGSLVGSPASE